MNIPPSTAARAAVRIARNRLADLRPLATGSSAEAGPLPDFIVVGAMKAGTTSLAGNLKQHPRIFMPRREVRFFNEHWHEGIAWYRRFFANGSNVVCGEKTPDYMRARRFMKRMGRVVPDAKIIVLLRDPVARLLSEINHRIQAGTLPAAERIDVDYVRSVILGSSLVRRRTVDRGFYLKQIRENVLPFFPRERVLIRATDAGARAIDRAGLHASRVKHQLTGPDADEATLQLVNEICGFLGVEPFSGTESFTVSGVRVYDAAATPEAKKIIFDLYVEQNEALFRFLGYEIGAWREEAAVHDGT